MKFVKGYLDSDGCIMIKNNKCHSSFVSISLELLEGIQDILFSLDIFSSLGLLRKTSIHKINEKYCNTKETYHLTLNNFDTILLSKLVDYKLPLEVFSEKNRNKRYGYFSPDKNFIYFRIRKIDKS
ncbi:MAG: LAGLIDADG family homing endonuclease [Nanoarchaeota archaeon]